MTNGRPRGDVLIENILKDGDDGRLSSALLNEFFDGYPLEKLVPLLHSEDVEIAKIGASIAGELGAQVRPLMPELTPLLAHPNKAVRYDILNAILCAATGADGDAVARAIMLVNDPELAVRKNALDFLARADREQLAGALARLTDSEFVSRLGWLIEVENPNAASDVEIESKLASEDRLARWFATVAAARAYRRNPALLDRMAIGRDDELWAFVQSQQKRFRLEPKRFRERH
jgi:hypothetical protein